MHNIPILEERQPTMLSHGKIIILAIKDIQSCLLVAFWWVILVESKTAVAAGVIARCIQIYENPGMAQCSAATITPCCTGLDCLRRYLCNQLDGKIRVYLFRCFHKTNQPIIILVPMLPSMSNGIFGWFHVFHYIRTWTTLMCQALCDLSEFRRISHARKHDL